MSIRSLVISQREKNCS